MTKKEFIQMLEQFDHMMPRFSCSLPDPDILPSIPMNVQMRREQLIKFRREWLILSEFAAQVCGTTIEELCPLHLMGYLYRDEMSPREDEEVEV